MLEFIALAQECAPSIEPEKLAAIVQVESNFNPYAIGVVDGYLKRQPKNKDEAIDTAKSLEKNGWNFSLGLAQVNRYNLNKYNLNYETVFNTCSNLKAASDIFNECLSRASKVYKEDKKAFLASLSCYYSGNFTRGFKPDKPGETPYVDKVFQQYQKISYNLDKKVSFDNSIPVIKTNKKNNNKPKFIPDKSPVLIKSPPSETPEYKANKEFLF